MADLPVDECLSGADLRLEPRLQKLDGVLGKVAQDVLHPPLQPLSDAVLAGEGCERCRGDGPQNDDMIDDTAETGCNEGKLPSEGTGETLCRYVERCTISELRSAIFTRTDRPRLLRLLDPTPPVTKLRGRSCRRATEASAENATVCLSRDRKSEFGPQPPLAAPRKTRSFLDGLTQISILRFKISLKVDTPPQRGPL